MQGEKWIKFSNTNFVNLGKVNLLIGKIEAMEYSWNEMVFGFWIDFNVIPVDAGISLIT